MNTRVRDLLGQRTFLTNAGTETYLVFQQGLELPEFCAFVVHEDEKAWAELERSYLDPILRAAAENGYGLMLDALVWRAQPDFIAKLGRAPEELGPVNEGAVSRTRASVDRWRRASGYDEESIPVLTVADIGPRGDGYRVENSEVTADAAREYHRPQIEALAEAGIDLVCALTMTTAAESIGIAESAATCGLPSLEAARARGESWLSRFRGFRANASTKSHEELDNSTELDRGDVQKLADQMAEMQAAYGLRVIGGCCGTDHEHLAAMALRSRRH